MARKAAASAPKPGLDRNRIGERLEASVAGLQELRLLRERQEAAVRKVLREAGGDRGPSPGELQPPGGAGDPALSLGEDEFQKSPVGDVKRQLGDLEPVSDGDPDVGPHTLVPTMNCPEAAGEPGEASRVDAPTSGVVGRGCPPPHRTLPCEERSRELWREDAGGEQAGSRDCGGSEEAGASVTPTGEHPRLEEELGSDTRLVEKAQDSGDSDSRPSSGFYDVTDSASCSLSTSRTSVSSECPSSSLWSVQSGCQPPRPSASRSRPRSTDDAAVRSTELSAQRLDGGGGWSRLNRRNRVSQRPVSAGELTFLCRDRGATRLSCSCPATSPSPGPGPRFRCDLVSRHGGEVYHYPSPLHAVALQSPLFTASSSRPTDGEEEAACVPELGPGPGAGAGTAAGTQAYPRASRDRLDRYICGLVLRSRPGTPLASQPKGFSLSPGCSQGHPGAWKGSRRGIATSCPAPATEAPAPEAPLYRGKHLHRELVRCPATGERDVPDHRGRRADLFKRLSSSRRSASRSSSEVNLSSASLHRPEASPGLECRPGPVRRKQKWTSVLEIPAPGRAKRSGLLGQAQAFLSRHHRASPGEGEEEEEEEEGGAGWVRGAQARTLPRAAPVPEAGFHRSRSFKELRRKVQLSIRPWSLKVNGAPK